MSSKPISSIAVVVQKLEYYCSYQERCHLEVQEKLRNFSVTNLERDRIIVHLIDHNFLNEERFASVFSISKFHQKNWGKIRIRSELKARRISDFLISKAVKEISMDAYQTAFDLLSEKYWDAITEKNVIKKRKKFCDFLLRKGWESELVYCRVRELEVV
ncbi:regulatory protein RecX [Flavobacterium sp.]|uniref:regulatory protein RecX n=1 Tax=Flavobacterium sp. TaxID=239 RepID=UPI003752610D